MSAKLVLIGQIGEMVFMKKAMVVLLVVAFATTAWGQMADEAMVENINRSTALGIKPAVSPFSLIDLSRVKPLNRFAKQTPARQCVEPVLLSIYWLNPFQP